jgi:hypothetical protein
LLEEMRPVRFRRDKHDHEAEPVELAGLADGSLAPERREALEAQIASSAELASLLEEQQRAVAMVRGAATEVDAPAGLRARIEVRRRGRQRRPLVLAGGLAVATAAAAAVALVVTLPGGVGGADVAQAATLAALPPTDAPPPPQPGEPKLLDLSVDGVPFPRYEDKFGWRASGQRTDSLDGQDTTTVFYRQAGDRIGYSIVSGDTLRVPGDAETVTRAGTELQVFEQGGRTVVTWLRKGRTCVLSGRGVPRDVLLDLAAWKGLGSIPF